MVSLVNPKAGNNIFFSEQIDAVYIPPEVDQLTDEEDFSNDPENNGNNQNGDIAGTFEIHNIQDDIYDDSDNEDLATKRRKIQEKNVTGHKPIWRAGSFLHQSLPLSKEEEQIKELSSALEGLSPLDIFFKFIDEDVMDLIIGFSEKYARDNNMHDFHLSREELLNFIGILILSGYHSLPQTDMYWSLDEDKTVNIVRDCMSRNKFRLIKRYLHLSDNNNLDKKDKYSKLRPFFDAMNEKFLQFGVFSFNLSIDEQMVPYFGRHSCKMFIKGKPVRFGFKLWCICSSSGYLYKFIPYAGAAEKTDLGLGASVVLELLSVVKNPRNHNIFFDNFFSSFKLFSLLKAKGFFSTGTIRDNRTSNCPFVPNKELSKRGRGSYDSQFDESTNISLVKWNDNSIVTAISTHYNVEPLTTAKRYDRKAKKEVSLPQPAVISSYNKYMGGVDLHDNGVANYRIRVMGKKWWWPLFINTIDSTLINAWKLYKTVNKNNIAQLNFKSYIAVRLLKTREHVSRELPLVPPREIRIDSSGHVISRTDSRRRCRVCKSQTIYICERCKVYLHADCFRQYHLTL